MKVRLYASLRERAGRTQLQLELPEGATAEAAWQALVAATPELAERRTGLGVAVNRAYTGFETVLRERDEVVFIPPVSGG